MPQDVQRIRHFALRMTSALEAYNLSDAIGGVWPQPYSFAQHVLCREKDREDACTHSAAPWPAGIAQVMLSCLACADRQAIPTQLGTAAQQSSVRNSTS